MILATTTQEGASLTLSAGVVVLILGLILQFAFNRRLFAAVLLFAAGVLATGTLAALATTIGNGLTSLLAGFGGG